jgi:hypothetical protein
VAIRAGKGGTGLGILKIPAAVTIGARIPVMIRATRVRVSTGAQAGPVATNIPDPLGMTEATGVGITTAEIAGLKVDVQNVMSVMIGATVGRKVPVPKVVSGVVLGSK